MSQTLLEQTFYDFTTVSERIDMLLSLTDYFQCSRVSDQDIPTDVILELYSVCLGSIRRTVHSLRDFYDRMVMEDSESRKDGGRQ